MAIGYLFLGLSAFIALGNVVGTLSAYRNWVGGIDKGYSQVPLLSMVFGAIAWFNFRDTLGLWVLVPAALDPGTWVSFCIPWVIWHCYWFDREKEQNKEDPLEQSET